MRAGVIFAQREGGGDRKKDRQREREGGRETHTRTHIPAHAHTHTRTHAHTHTRNQRENVCQWVRHRFKLLAYQVVGGEHGVKRNRPVHVKLRHHERLLFGDNERALLLCNKLRQDFLLPNRVRCNEKECF